MGSIKDKVAIIGMGCTQFGELWDKGLGELFHTLPDCSINLAHGIPSVFPES